MLRGRGGNTDGEIQCAILHGNLAYQLLEQSNHISSYEPDSSAQREECTCRLQGDLPLQSVTHTHTTSTPPMFILMQVVTLHGDKHTNTHKYTMTHYPEVHSGIMAFCVYVWGRLK